MMNFSELLKNRRSVRRFQDKAVDLNLLKEILHDTCIAPSASNGQPWRFIIVQDKQLMKRLSDESKKNLVAEIVASPQTEYAKYLSILQRDDYNVFYNAPCLVIIVGNKHDLFLYEDCSLAASYFMFSATARGLGTCWIGLGDDIRDKDLRQQIGLNDDLQIVAPLIIGYPGQRIATKISRNEPQILKVI